MNISELIRQLEEWQQRHGDLPVAVVMSGYYPGEVRSTRLESLWLGDLCFGAVRGPHLTVVLTNREEQDEQGT